MIESDFVLPVQATSDEVAALYKQNPITALLHPSCHIDLLLKNRYRWDAVLNNPILDILSLENPCLYEEIVLSCHSARYEILLNNFLHLSYDFDYKLKICRWIDMYFEQCINKIMHSFNLDIKKHEICFRYIDNDSIWFTFDNKFRQDSLVKLFKNDDGLSDFHKLRIGFKNININEFNKINASDVHGITWLPLAFTESRRFIRFCLDFHGLLNKKCEIREGKPISQYPINANDDYSGLENETRRIYTILRSAYNSLCQHLGVDKDENFPRAI